MAKIALLFEKVTFVVGRLLGPFLPKGLENYHFQSHSLRCTNKSSDFHQYSVQVLFNIIYLRGTCVNLLLTIDRTSRNISGLGHVRLVRLCCDQKYQIW